jgi:hypothetical protein
MTARPAIVAAGLSQISRGTNKIVRTCVEQVSDTKSSSQNFQLNIDIIARFHDPFMTTRA